MNLNLVYSGLSGLTSNVNVTFLSPVTDLMFLKILDSIALTVATDFFDVAFHRLFFRDTSIE